MSTLMQWLEPAIQKRVDEVYYITDESEGVIQGQNEFDIIMEKLKELLPEEGRLLNKLCESVTTIRASGEEVAYRSGFKDGLGISREINPVTMIHQ
ncbi:hypothetical protein [Brevibacillus laterosporus]|uniref:hypothetical protein n=1 Tax=Brevibacillus laterosporus TaxID=1465 RepID=UPI0014442F4E|nr:hypothetical protein [Brevibacillus laterosporus]NKQ18432.1 hypothetical protein [Brevibacillus laterosporus]WNX33200.1 hypothetical protein RWW94_10570 [Brevibacillus laterosporus]